MRPNGPTMQRIFRAVPAALVLASVVLSGTARAETISVLCSIFGTQETIIIDETKSSVSKIDSWDGRMWGPYAAQINTAEITWTDGADHTPRATTYFTLNRLAGRLTLRDRVGSSHYQCVKTNAPQPKF